jgi:(heptosyl)LPS beta-1,4-glucosyltransferase
MNKKTTTAKISAIVNIRNEAQYLEDCLKSLKWVDEIIVVDMESTDDGAEIAQRYTHHVYTHKALNYVEPARNYGLSKATGDWIIIVDPDERVKSTLAEKLLAIAEDSQVDFVRIPRQNIIFGQWMSHTRWWPDYNIRFFRRGRVEWQDEIHSVPITYGTGINLDITEDLSLTHIHYATIEEYLTRSIRYSKVQAQELIDSGYKFDHRDLLLKPFQEFISRFFAGEGYKDGWHGFVLSLLQAFSALFVYSLVWQEHKFRPQSDDKFATHFFASCTHMARELRYWILTYQISIEKRPLVKQIKRLIRKTYT